jgi:DNA-binding NarL/FixJ family response regulator
MINRWSWLGSANYSVTSALGRRTQRWPALVEVTLQRRPDLIILAVGLPLLSGIDAARQIKVQWPQARLLFLTMHRRFAFVQRALEAGASGYVLKSAPLEEIRRAIDVVLNGKIYISSRAWRGRSGASAERQR